MQLGRRKWIVIAACLMLAAYINGKISDHARYQEAKDYFFGQNGKAQDYDKARELLLPFADAGDSDAQLKMGYLYDYGDGVPVSKETAETWYKLSAAQGNQDAAENLRTLDERHPSFASMVFRALAAGLANSGDGGDSDSGDQPRGPTQHYDSNGDPDGYTRQDGSSDNNPNGGGDGRDPD